MRIRLRAKLFILYSMGKLFIKRKKSLELSPIQIEIDNKKFHIEWGEKKEINLSAGKYEIIVHGLFGTRGSIEIIEDKPTSIVLTQILPNELSVIAISILLLMFVLSYVGLIPFIIYWGYIMICSVFFFVYNLVKRKKYFRFEKEP